MNKPKLKPRALQAEQSKKVIYEAALQLFREKGFTETSIINICERAGTSVGNFYHHFGSKDGILTEDFRRADELFTVYAHEKLQQPDGKDRVLAYFGYYADFVANTSGLDLSKHLYSALNKHFVAEGRPMQVELTATIEKALQEGDFELEIGAKEACEWLFICARGLVFHWCLKDGSFSLENAMQQCISRALHAIMI